MLGHYRSLDASVHHAFTPLLACAWVKPALALLLAIADTQPHAQSITRNCICGLLALGTFGFEEAALCCGLCSCFVDDGCLQADRHGF